MGYSKNKSASITFVRGARQVTGSNFLLTVQAQNGKKVNVLVDCGLTQGARFCESKNSVPFPYTASEIDAVFVTHAHADHIGLLPKLLKEGFDGPIYTTAPTKDLIPIMLEDSVTLINREAKSCNEDPPYSKEDVVNVSKKLTEVAYRQTVDIAPEFSCTVYNAGHIVGSATFLFDISGTRILFTGDLGRRDAILVPERDIPPHPIHYLVTESVYGNRVHEDGEASEIDLQNAISWVHKKNGVLLIPAFSLERTQIILSLLQKLIETKKVPPIPVYMDSPLAAKVTEVYRSHPDFLIDEVKQDIQKGGDPFSFPLLTVTQSKEESEEALRASTPKVIIAGAGMSHGGRIRTHEAEFLPDDTTLLLLVGYQTPGSLGRRLKDGAKKVKINWKDVKVRAVVRSTGGFSAHADRDDLVSFAEAVAPQKAFVVLGEMESASFLAQRISGFLGIEADIPQEGEVVDIPLIG
ncbi:MBL fold metallo-hydrolase [Candidatus Kaiserbacteria bacterium CG10_big_fil_rev_8_21_14_0_10_45_20]|uniref:MBL fold metallo-hydrolase n=1 Tax=Candidatus Kaiserbacteria bacterium CG10_big_fil_rev_8_21_14_0_10_45_20 TaxID=1974607 RepID=A0A2H0UFI6_9BACT|nr:MAG: MBL fold metallo-hydrolase [Candidatus Kaiserbacteria bacterium CG10_big_fil_rev_8_21_14_0_10_45_20]